METFEIILKNDKAKTYRFIILLLLLINVVFVIYLLFNHHLWEIIVAIIFGDIILLFLSILALKKTSLYFTSSNIEKRIFPFKKYSWDDVSNVILKDHLITIDFKNNKLLQAEIQNISIDENAFNTFAKAQLNK